MQSAIACMNASLLLCSVSQSSVNTTDVGTGWAVSGGGPSMAAVPADERKATQQQEATVRGIPEVCSSARKQRRLQQVGRGSVLPSAHTQRLHPPKASGLTLTFPIRVQSSRLSQP